MVLFLRGTTEEPFMVLYIFEEFTRRDSMQSVQSYLGVLLIYYRNKRHVSYLHV